MFKKIINGLIIVVPLCLMISCGQKQGNTGADGYYFEKETLTRTDLALHIVLVKNQTEMNKLLAEHGRTVASGREVAAFSAYSPVEPKCTIYMIDPKMSYEPEFIGHELVHCVYGNWHTVQP
jgi:hypothetical protein